MPKAAAYTLAWSSLHLAYELRAPDGDVALRMQHEESAWFAWLAQGSSFAFEGRTPAGCCLLHQETKQRGTGYWYAYQRSGKKLRKKYVGKAAAVTLARLEEVAHSLPPSALAAPEESMARRSPPPNASDPPHDPLRATKLHVPRPHSHLLHRPHLTERLQRGQEEGALILLSAPAGYGKTTLLADWLGRFAFQIDDVGFLE